jgi:hypothetical protein
VHKQMGSYKLKYLCVGESQSPLFRTR